MDGSDWAGVVSDKLFEAGLKVGKLRREIDELALTNASLREMNEQLSKLNTLAQEAHKVATAQLESRAMAIAKMGDHLRQQERQMKEPSSSELVKILEAHVGNPQDMGDMFDEMAGILVYLARYVEANANSTYRMPEDFTHRVLKARQRLADITGAPKPEAPASALIPGGES